MFLGILAGVILGVITSFFGMFELFEDILCSKFFYISICVFPNFI